MSRSFLTLAIIAIVLAANGITLVTAETAPPADLKYRVVAPGISRAEPAPTPSPTPKPVPYAGPVAWLYLASAGVSAQWPVESRDTTFVSGRETFQDPSSPERIAWYTRFGQPGYPANNSIFAAHINYVGFGAGPFANLAEAVPGDALYVSMVNGDLHTYTVISVDIVPLAALENGAMDAYVFPALGLHDEQVTLISCGGDFVERPGGGGDYTSRIILVARRYVD
ncbi:MAG: class F sortase [Dehalococcoidia bacterium]|uniref:class F sortase n=1 Tax=Candidatus Amarobacter glycogenicus TaxID=3140699 RepID=UPI003136AAFE|nr:class F sortase [Dehalococcoidia bacterium]